MTPASLANIPLCILVKGRGDTNNLQIQYYVNIKALSNMHLHPLERAPHQNTTFVLWGEET